MKLTGILIAAVVTVLLNNDAMAQDKFFNFEKKFLNPDSLLYSTAFKNDFKRIVNGVKNTPQGIKTRYELEEDQYVITVQSAGVNFRCKTDLNFNLIWLCQVISVKDTELKQFGLEQYFKPGETNLKRFKNKKGNTFVILTADKVITSRIEVASLSDIPGF